MEHSLSNSPARVGVFEHPHQADAAVDELVRAGFTPDEITVICPECRADAFAHRAEREPSSEARGEAPARKAAATGGTIGAVLGGLIALAGVAASGGMGILAAGPFFAGAGGGAVAGGLIGAMTRRGIQHDVADFYDQAVQKGQVLVAVEPRGDVAEARLHMAELVLARSGGQPLPIEKA